MIIEVFIRSVYGRDLVYPACVRAKVFAKLSGTDTLTATAIDLIKQLGYTVSVVAERKGEL